MTISALRFFTAPQVHEPVAETPKPSLFARVMVAGKSLKSMKREDLAWMGGNVAIGAAAAFLGKAGLTLAVSSLGATALAGTASVIAVGAVSAVAGGVLSAVARGALQHIRDQKNVEREEPRSFMKALKEETSSFYNSQQFRDKVKKSTKSALLGAGLLGAVYEINSFLEETEAGKAISASLKDTFQSAVDRGFASWNESRNNLHTKLPLSSAEAKATLSATSNLKAAPFSAPAQTVLPANDVATTATKPKLMTTAPVNVGAETGVYNGPHKTLSANIREKALAWARGLNSAPADIATPSISQAKIDPAQLAGTNVVDIDLKTMVVRTNSGVEVKLPAIPVPEKELEIVRKVIAEAGEDVPQVYLDSNKMAAVCVADLPATEEALVKQSGVLPNTCVVVNGKDEMAAGDYVLVRDAAEPAPNAKRGVRALVSAFTEKTSEFISRAVTAETLPSMSAEKLAAAAPAP